MRLISLGKTLAGCGLLFAAIIALFGLVSPSITLADGEGPSTSIAMTGTFGGHHYEIPAGSSVSSPDISITVINDGEVSYNVNMTTVAPIGVNINLSSTEFSLDPGESQPISIEIQTTKDAAAGDYTLSIKAATSIVISGIQTSAESAENAYLTVTGDSARVWVTSVSPDGQPVPAVVRLFKLIDERLSEVCYNESGYLQAIVAPGNFTAQAYVGGKLLDEKTFDVAADDNISVSLQAGTIYIQNPGVIQYNDSNSRLAYAHIYYTLINVYQAVENVNVILLIKLNGNQIDEREIYPQQPLNIGSANGLYDYMPTNGWTNGAYSFRLNLYVNNVPYDSSPELPFDVEGNGATGINENSNMPLIVGIVCAVVLLLDIAFYMIYRSRKAKHVHSGTKRKSRRMK